MLWTVLTAISSLAFFWAAVKTAHDSQVGLAFYVPVGSAGMLLALANAWGLSRLACFVTRQLENRTERQQENWLRGLYVATAAWALFAAPFLSSIASSAVIRLLA